MEGDGQYVADGGPVLIACGQGKSMYDVKGCLSSWVLLNGGPGVPKGGVSEKLAAAGGAGAAGSGGQGGFSNSSTTRGVFRHYPSSTWLVRVSLHKKGLDVWHCPLSLWPRNQT